MSNFDLFSNIAEGIAKQIYLLTAKMRAAKMPRISHTEVTKAGKNDICNEIEIAGCLQ